MRPVIGRADINDGRGIWAIVPAAGIGQRMAAGLPKQYLPIHGEPMLLHTLRALAAHPAVVGIQLALAEDDTHWAKVEAAARESLPVELRCCEGGASRAESVSAALRALPENVAGEDWILVHDAARPCLALDDLDRLVFALLQEADGAILAAPMADTVKQSCDGGDRIIATLPRETLWRALTPQAARRSQLSQALLDAAVAGAAITDEASALEFAGLKPRLVAGRSENIKVTEPTDLRLAAMLLSNPDRD